MSEPDPHQHTPPARSGCRGPDLSHELGGDLPCVVCGYNLRGHSIRALCPECGTGIRATILAVVDPFASELQPIRFPRIIAILINMWTGGALFAALLAWLPIVYDLLNAAGWRLARPDINVALLASLAVSGIGALGLIRPHARVGTFGPALAIL